MEKEIIIVRGPIKLGGFISSPENPRSWVIFAHGSGSSRMSPRNRWVAQELNERGHATLLFDLLTHDEDQTYDNRFNISLLSERLLLATDYLLRSPEYRGQPISYFGASTGAAAALTAAAQPDDDHGIFTVISRGGRPDLAQEETLSKVSVPVLLIVGGLDEDVLLLNQMASDHLRNSKIAIVEGATHLFEEPGKLDDVVDLTVKWLETHLETRGCEPGRIDPNREARL